MHLIIIYAYGRCSGAPRLKGVLRCYIFSYIYIMNINNNYNMLTNTCLHQNLSIIFINQIIFVHNYHIGSDVTSVLPISKKRTYLKF